MAGGRPSLAPRWGGSAGCGSTCSPNRRRVACSAAAVSALCRPYPKLDLGGKAPERRPPRGALVAQLVGGLPHGHGHVAQLRPVGPLEGENLAPLGRRLI